MVRQRVVAHERPEAFTRPDRKAHWLKSDYSDPVWTVADTDKPDRTCTIDFRLLMADGRLLTEIESLCATVKEYAWWVRDPRFSRVDDASVHARFVRNLMYVAHAFTLDEVFSFYDAEPDHIKKIEYSVSFGVDGVIRASERIGWLESELRSDSGGATATRLKRIAGRTLTTGRILAECNLPDGVSNCPGVSKGVKRIAAVLGCALPGQLEPPIDEWRNVHTVQSIQRWLDPLEQLYAMRGVLKADCLKRRPFPKGAAKIAKVMGSPTRKTPTPKPRLALNLMEQAAKVILEYDDSTDKVPSEGERITELLTACWIIIATFTARRSEEIAIIGDDPSDEELKELQGACLKGSDKAGWYLWAYVAKTWKRKVWIPVPTIVARAIEILRITSAAARMQSQEISFFQKLDDNGQSQHFAVARHLDKFADRAGAIAYKDAHGEPASWHWSPHQFRRFFAVLYFYRGDNASIEALSYFLRHFSLEMTRQYIERDPEVAAIWWDPEWGFRGEIAREVAVAGRSVTGAAGDRYSAYADSLRRTIKLVNPERITAYIELRMREDAVVLTPMPWALCTCPRTGAAARSAACRVKAGAELGAVGRDGSQAEPSLCLGCPHALVQKHHGIALDAEIENLKQVARSPQCLKSILGEWTRSKLVTLEDAREKYFSHDRA